MNYCNYCGLHTEHDECPECGRALVPDDMHEAHTEQEEDA